MSHQQYLKQNFPDDYVGSTFFQTKEQFNTAYNNGITVGPNGHTFFQGNSVIVLTRDKKTKQYYGFLSVANGTYYGPAGSYFEGFSRPKVIVNGIDPVTRVHKIPRRVVGNLTNGGVSIKKRDAVACYLMEQEGKTRTTIVVSQSAALVHPSTFVAEKKQNSFAQMFANLLQSVKSLVETVFTGAKL